MTRPNIVAIIPARYASTRFPGKPLIRVGGITMIERVYRQSEKASLVNEVLVATDDQRIAEAVADFGGEVIMTRSTHASGTDRLAEVASARPEIDIIVNVQGDEPMIDPGAIDAAIQPLLKDPTVRMSTLSRRATAEEAANPNLVKVVPDKEGFALYFSRAPIPYYRDGREIEKRVHWGHTGMYVYRRECLLQLAGLEPTPLEIAECLEQLRALENGIRIKVVESEYQSLAIDVPEDLQVVEAALTKQTHH